MAERLPFIYPLHRQRLKDQGFLRASSKAGFQLIHQRRVFKSSDEIHKHIPLDVPPGSPITHLAFAVVPINVISPASLATMGFTTAKANELWNIWQDKWRTVINVSTDSEQRQIALFINFIWDLIREMTLPILCHRLYIKDCDDPDPDDDLDHDDWEICLSVLGINDKVRNLVMDTRYVYNERWPLRYNIVRLILDTIRDRFRSMLAMRAYSKTREEELERERVALQEEEDDDEPRWVPIGRGNQFILVNGKK